MAHFYPTSVSKDFTQEQISEARMTVMRPLADIYKKCLEFHSAGRFLDLTCLLRIILEMPVTPPNAALVGWFAINGLIPAPTLYLYINQLLSKREEYEGEKCCIAFAQEIIPYSYKFTAFLESVATIPGFCYRNPDLYITITQMLDSPVKIESYISWTRFAIPSAPRKIPIPPNSRFHLLPIVQSQNEPPMKQTIDECVQACYHMPEENRRHYLISFVLNTQIPDSIRDSPKILLEAVCVYAKHLLSNAIRDVRGRIGWERFNYHAQIHQTGMWIGLLSISRGPPPPLYYIDMHKILRESVKLGCFREVVILLTGYFSRACQVYLLPCPYTSSILEIMAAVVNHPGVRLDVLQAVDTFASLIGTKISFFYNRQIDIDPTSFDMESVFQMDHVTKQFFLGPNQKDSLVDNSPERVYNFFNYSPTYDSIPDILKPTFEKAEHVRKYYFQGSGTDIFIPKDFDIPRQKVINAVLSMALSHNQVLSSTVSKMLPKLIVPPFSLDQTRLRYAFPNHDIFLSCVNSNLMDPREINNIYCDILTNTQTGPIAFPMVQRLIPHISKLMRKYPNANFTSLFALCGMQPPLDDQKLPTPDHAHIPLLRYFIHYCKTGDEEARTEFISKFSPGTHQQVTALIQTIIASVSENSRDYTAVDCYAAMLPHLPSKILNESLLTGLLKAFELFTPSMVVNYQQALFRVAYETFTAIKDLNPIKLIPFFTHYSPGCIPGFAACWMQLVFHPHVLPYLIQSADPTAIAFCLRFFIAIIKLAVNMPDGFYRPVVRALITLSDQFPLFVTSYHCLLLEHVPPRFTQIRNIILSANPGTDSHSPPPIGIITGDSSDMKTLKLNAEPFITDKAQANLQEHMNTIIETVFQAVSQDSSVIWRFIFFCIAAYSQTHEKYSTKDTINELMMGLVNISPIFISALLDHVRYPNSHSRIVLEMLFNIYNRVQSEQKEAFIIELLRRILCVTQPPEAVRRLFVRIWEDKKSEITEIAQRNGEAQELEEVAKCLQLLPNLKF